MEHVDAMKAGEGQHVKDQVALELMLIARDMDSAIQGHMCANVTTDGLGKDVMYQIALVILTALEEVKFLLWR